MTLTEQLAHTIRMWAGLKRKQDLTCALYIPSLCDNGDCALENSDDRYKYCPSKDKPIGMK